MCYHIKGLRLIELRGYIDERGNKRFADWMTVALARLEQGNFSSVKGVGSGVFEYKIDFGPGYRIYFGKDGEKLVILLRGGAKKSQQHDITGAIKCWAAYRQRKKQET